MYRLIFYKDRNGKEAIRDYLLELKAKSQTSKNERIRFNKINTYFRALQEYGTRVGNPVVKHIDGDIWELRPLLLEREYFCAASPLHEKVAENTAQRD